MLIDILYSMVIVVNVLAYVPQILKLLHARSDCREISLQTWTLWLATALITIAYAALRVNDPKFIIASLANGSCIAIVTVLILRARLSYNAKTSPQTQTTRTNKPALFK